MKYSIISLGLFLTTLCIYDVSYGDIINEKDLNQIRQDLLNKTNYYRKSFDMDSLTMNNELQEEAQKWAEESAKHIDFKNRTSRYELYLYEIVPFKHVGEVVVDMWYMEMPYTQLNKNDESKYNDEQSRIFYQQFWKSTKSMGIGVAKDITLKLLHFVVIYDPPGNILGKYKHNEPEFDINKAAAEYVKNKNYDVFLKGKTFQSGFDNEGESPLLPGWQSHLYPTPDVELDLTIIDTESSDYKRLFGNSVLDNITTKKLYFSNISSTIKLDRKPSVYESFLNLFLNCSQCVKL